MGYCFECRNIKKSRKEHICELCGDTIPKGSSYKDRVVTDGGNLYHYKEHNECDKVFNKLWDFMDIWDDPGADEFQEALQNFWFDIICPNCKHYKECELNNFDDCPCKQDTMSDYDKVNHIYNLLKYATLIYINNKWCLLNNRYTKPITFEVVLKENV